MSGEISRRRVLAGLLVTMAGAGMSGVRAMAARPDRIAVIDWALLETLLAIGITPVAAAELVQYRQTVIEPPLPAGVIDLGLRGALNFEVLRLAAPDLILNSGFHAWADPNLARIAPVLSLSIHRPDAAPYAAAEAATRILGARFDRMAAAEACIAATARAIDVAAEGLAARAGGRPVFLVSLGDARHVSAFGTDAMFGQVLARMGLANAWTGLTRYSGNAPVGIEALAERPDAWIAIIGPTAPDALRGLFRSRLWQALPAVREERVVILDPVNPFGGLPSAARFARLLAAGIHAAGIHAVGADGRRADG